MAFHHGKKAVVKVDNASGTLTDISDFTDSVSWSGQRDLGQVTAFGDNDHAFLDGVRNTTFTMSGSVDPSVTTTLIGIYNAQDSSRSFEINPAGTASGLPKLTGEAFMTSLDVSATTANKVAWSAGFQVSGLVTLAAN